MDNNNEHLKDLLLEDYRYRAEAFRQSEAIGETHLNIFVGFAAILLGILVNLGTQENGPKNETLIFFTMLVFGVLVMLGLMTLLRLIKRNNLTDECKDDLDHIRQTFKDVYDIGSLLEDYHPVGNSPKKRNFGGLVDLMSVINGVLFSAFVICVLLLQNVTVLSYESIGILSILAGIFFFVGQLRYIQRASIEENNSSSHPSVPE